MDTQPPSGRWCEWSGVLAEFDRPTTDSRVLKMSTAPYWKGIHPQIPLLAGPDRNLVGAVTDLSYGTPLLQLREWILEAEGNVNWDMLNEADPALAQDLWDGKRLDISFAIVDQETEYFPDRELHVSSGPWRVTDATLGLKSGWAIAYAQATTMHWNGAY